MAEFVYYTDEQLAAASPQEQIRYFKYLKRIQWRLDPALWMRERMAEFPWSKQIEVMESVRDNHRTAVPAGFDLGKSFIASRIVCWWVDTMDTGTGFALTTAPTKDQVEGVLWAEINFAHEKAGLAGVCSVDKWRIGKHLVAQGRKPSNYSKASFQGTHRTDGVLVVLDEAAGMAPLFWEGAEGIAANDDSRILAIGNPETADSEFGKACDPRNSHLWNVVTIRALDSPNITGEDVPDVIKRALVNNAWIEWAREIHGEDSIFWKTKVLATFVRDNADLVVPYSFASRCTHREDGIDEALATPVELGADIGAGGDETVIRERRGRYAGRVWRSRHDDPMLCADEILVAQHATQATSIKIDAVGVGWGVHGIVESELRRRGINCKAHAVKVGMASTAPEKYVNLRSQVWWEVGRELSRTGGWDLTGVDDQTINELCEPKFRKDSSGRIVVEPKDETKKRLKRSPDNADSLLLAFYQPAELGMFFLGTV